MAGNINNAPGLSRTTLKGEVNPPPEPWTTLCSATLQHGGCCPPRRSCIRQNHATWGRDVLAPERINNSICLVLIKPNPDSPRCWNITLKFVKLQPAVICHTSQHTPHHTEWNFPWNPEHCEGESFLCLTMFWFRHHYWFFLKLIWQRQVNQIGL